MKNILRSIAIICFLSLSLVSNAQKIGHVSLDSLLSLMPESKAAKQAGQEYYKQLESQVANMQSELQKKYQEYQEKMATYSDIIKQTKEKELQDLNQRIQDFQVSAQQDLQKKNDELSRPVYTKAKKAIDQVAKENGYKYIFDTSSGVVLFSEPSDDVIGLVIKKLGIAATGATPANTAPVSPMAPEKKK